MITIAIAEDCEDHIKKLTHIIERKNNFKIIKHTYNGLKMIEWLSQTTEIPQVLIVDYEMNPMDGQQLTHFVNYFYKYKNIKILALSGHDHHYAVNSMFQCGAVGFQNKAVLFSGDKDYTIEVISNAIETVAKNNFYFDNYINSTIFSIDGNNVFALQNAYTYNLSCRINYFKITDCEYRVMYLFCCGFKTSQIGNIICNSDRTIENHLRNVKKKLSVNNDRDLAQQVIRLNIMPSARYEKISA